MSLPITVLRNGELIPPEQAAVSVFNPAIYGSFGVYESMQSVSGVVFEQRRHLQRLFHSAEILELPLPADLACFEAWIGTSLSANAAPDCTVRLFVVGPDHDAESVAFIWPQPATVLPPNYYSHGATALLFEGQRVLPQAKSLNTLTSFLARRRAHMDGVHEALLHHNGYLTEGSNSNLFAIMDGVLQTACAEDVLSGVTRDVVLELARAAGVPTLEAKIAVSGVVRWDECFITSTSRHILPITQIDGAAVGTGAVGPVTQRLMALFEAHFRERIALEQPWLPLTLG